MSNFDDDDCGDDHNDVSGPAIYPARSGETLAEEEGRVLSQVTQDVMLGVTPDQDPSTVLEANVLEDVDPTFSPKLDAAIQEGEILRDQMLDSDDDEE